MTIPANPVIVKRLLAQNLGLPDDKFALRKRKSGYSVVITHENADRLIAAEQALAPQFNVAIVKGCLLVRARKRSVLEDHLVLSHQARMTNLQQCLRERKTLHEQYKRRPYYRNGHARTSYTGERLREQIRHIVSGLRMVREAIAEYNVLSAGNTIYLSETLWPIPLRG